MYSQCPENGPSGKTNCVEVVGNIFPEIHWDPNNEHYWACNVLDDSSEDDHQNHKWVQNIQETDINTNQELSLAQRANDINASVIPAVTYERYFNCNDPRVPNIHNNPLNVSQNFNETQMIPPPNFLPSNFLNTHPNLGKPHQFHITSKITREGVKTTINKRKRKRTMFTTEQIVTLEKVFSKKPYINREDRQVLVEDLQINDRAIKVWFQNRRLKEKREAAEAEQDIYSPDVASTEETMFRFDRLSYVESKINQTDEYGYVTLDDRAMSELVTVIDNVLTKEPATNCLVEAKEETESEGSTIYEPISPAPSEVDSTSNKNDSSRWQPFEPKESLQRLLELQQFLVFNNTRA